MSHSIDAGPTPPPGATGSKPGKTPWTPGMVTRSFLGWGVLAGPVYVIVGAVQALTREGFDLTRHPLSVLSAGPYGWLQIVNFVLSGAMLIAGAIGLVRAAGTGGGSRWGARLVGLFGVGLVAAGVFVSDPIAGYPPGSGETTQLSWHGALHLVAGTIGFGSLVVAAIVYARLFGRRKDTGWSVFSAVTGIVVLVGFAGIASGSTAAVVTVFFTAAVVLGWTWLSTLCVRTYREVST